METLKRARDFDRIFRSGRSTASKEIILYCHRCREPAGRVGFCISRKLGKAVVRNRLRRRLREVYRRQHQNLNPKWDLILLARAGAIQATFQQLEAAFVDLSRRAGLRRELACSRAWQPE